MISFCDPVGWWLLKEILMFVVLFTETVVWYKFEGETKK